jgi:hypothetical protein
MLNLYCKQVKLHILGLGTLISATMMTGRKLSCSQTGVPYGNWAKLVTSLAIIPVAVSQATLKLGENHVTLAHGLFGNEHKIMHPEQVLESCESCVSLSFLLR